MTGSSRNETDPRRLLFLLPYLPLLLAVLIMLPRLLSPQFGLFDDGHTLTIAQRISAGDWYTGQDTLAGRFRPLHWIWFTFWYLVGGKDPLWFFVGNTLGLVIVTWGITTLVQRAGGKPWQAMLAGLFFVAVGPIAEAFFTLKGEVPQAILLVLAVSAMLLHGRCRSPLQKGLVFLLMVALLLAADLTKETSIVLLPISLVWYGLSRWVGKDPRRRAMHGLFTLANLIAVPVFFLARTWVISFQVNTGQYTQRYAIDLGQTLQSLLRWGGWLMRDFLWVAPIFVVAILLAGLHRRLRSVLLLESSIWVLAWIGLYLPWNFMAEYYLLPCAMGLAVLAAALVGEIVPYLRSGEWKAGLGWAALCLSSLLLLGAISNLVTNARVQLTMDRMNDQMRSFFAEQAAEGSLILINFEEQKEYPGEIQAQFDLFYGRPDLQVKIFDPSAPLPESSGGTYLAEPVIFNQPQMTVRMGVVEEWQLLRNDILWEYTYANPGWDKVFTVEQQFTLSDVNYPRIFCPLVQTNSFCATPVPFIDTRSFSYGWTIYQLEQP